MTSKLFDLGVLVSLGAGIALSAILSGVVGGLAAHVAGWVGLGESGWAVRVVGLVTGVSFGPGLLVLLLRVPSGVPGEEPASPAEAPDAHPTEHYAAHRDPQPARSRTVARVSLVAGTVTGAVPGVDMSSTRQLWSRPHRCRAGQGHRRECRL